MSDPFRRSRGGAHHSGSIGDVPYEGTVEQQFSACEQAFRTCVQIIQNLRRDSSDAKIPVDQIQVRTESARILVKKSLTTLDMLAKQFWDEGKT